MSDFQDWVDHEEEEEEQREAEEEENPQARRRLMADPANRKSVVIHVAGDSHHPPESDSTMSLSSKREQKEQMEQAEDEAGADLGRRGTRSRLFPGMEIQTREQKLASGKKEEEVKEESRVPWVLIALLFCFGGLAMVVFGGMCIHQAFQETVASFDACGPGGGIFLSFPFLSFPFLSFPFLSFPFLSFPFLSC